MDLFQSVDKTYTPPKASARIVDWMIYDAVGGADRCFDILRRRGASDLYIEAVIRRRWNAGRCRTGYWGAYSARAQPGESLLFGWAVSISTRAFFTQHEDQIRGKEVVDAVRRVTAIPAVDEQHDLTYLPTSEPVDRLHSIGYKSAVHNLAPMSMRAQYQSGAVDLHWPEEPARSVPAVRLDSLESWGIGRMIRRAQQREEPDGNRQRAARPGPHRKASHELPKH